MKGHYIGKIILASAFAFFVSMAFGSFAFSQVSKKVNEVGREGRFIAYDNGTVLDTETGLMWAAKDDGEGMGEQDAKAYFVNYRGGGYADWRMPTVEELEAIYDQDIQNKQGFHVTRLIDISGEWVWCSEGPESVTSFNFKDGSRPLAFFEGPGSGTWYSTEQPLAAANRVLPVRYAGDIEKMKTALPLLPEKEIDIAIFPWLFRMEAAPAYADEKLITADSIEGLSQFLKEHKLVVPKFSYYDLGNAKNIKGNPLTEAIVNDIWIEESTFSKSKMNLDLIIRLGRQLQVDAVLISSVYIRARGQYADIILIDMETKKTYSKTGEVYMKGLSSDIKYITEDLFIDYVNQKYKQNPDYEMIFWDFIKHSQSEKSIKQYLSNFPDGMLTGLAKYKITRLPRDKSKKFGKAGKNDTQTDTQKKFEVTIFPWRFKLPQWYADPSPSIDACLNGVFDIIQKFDEIELKFSYYENKKFRQANVEPIKSLIENNEKAFWLKKPSSFDFQPNYYVIYAYGEQLNADLVFLTAIESSGILENVKVYLIDIKNKKIYGAIDRHPDSPTDAFLALSKKAIENFLRETKKASRE
jgi:hypothetical protein